MQTSIRLFYVILVLATGLLLLPACQPEERQSEVLQPEELKLSRAAMLSASCEGCHGTYGRSPGAIPPIAGKSGEYLRETMEGFRAMDTEATVMGRHVKGYSEEEIHLIAEYFSQQSEQ